MKHLVLIFALTLSACGGSAPTVSHRTVREAIRFACEAALAVIPDDATVPTATTTGGEATP